MVRKLKTDEEYKKIDLEDKKKEEELFKKTLENAREFDKSNKKWLEFIKLMPKEIQEQIIYASPFHSTAVMIWSMVGDAKTRDMKRFIIEDFERGLLTTPYTKEISKINSMVNKGR